MKSTDASIYVLFGVCARALVCVWRFLIVAWPFYFQLLPLSPRLRFATNKIVMYQFLRIRNIELLGRKDSPRAIRTTLEAP